MPVIGALRWAIAEGYIPGWSTGPAPQMESHETVSILNAGARDAQVVIVIYFADRGPAPQLESPETACILNAGEPDAQVESVIYFADREPAGLTGSWCLRGARVICASMNFETPSRCRATPTSPVS